MLDCLVKSTIQKVSGLRHADVTSICDFLGLAIAPLGIQTALLTAAAPLSIQMRVLLAAAAPLSIQTALLASAAPLSIQTALLGGSRSRCATKHSDGPADSRCK